eukprot:15365890-Ditylum_brightwellii.AAC.2
MRKTSSSDKESTTSDALEDSANATKGGNKKGRGKDQEIPPKGSVQLKIGNAQHHGTNKM